MAYTNRVAWQTLLKFNTTGLSGSYKLIGSFPQPSYILKMINLSGQDVLVSTDGATDQDVCPAGGFFLYDEYKDMGREFLPALTPIYIRNPAGDVASTNFIYVVSQYLVVG